MLGYRGKSHAGEGDGMNSRVVICLQALFVVAALAFTYFEQPYTGVMLAVSAVLFPYTNQLARRR